jgi:hypothetical protein
MLASLEASPSVRYGADVQVLTPDRWQWEISAMMLEKNEYYNRTLERYVYRTAASLPLAFGALQTSLHAAASRISSSTMTIDEQSAALSLSPGSWSADITERISRSYDGDVLSGKASALTGSLLYGFSGVFWRPASIGDLLLNVSVTFDQYVRKASLFRCDLSACIFKTGRCRIGIERDMPGRCTTATMLLTFDFDCVHTASMVQIGSHETETQTISGALVFNQAEGTVEMFGRPWDGTTGAEMRMFLSIVQSVSDMRRLFKKKKTAALNYGNSFRMSVTMWISGMLPVKIIYGHRSTLRFPLLRIRTRSKLSTFLLLLWDLSKGR